MSARRASAALAALVAYAALATAQDALIHVEVASHKAEDTDNKYTPQLQHELHSAKTDALMLYTEFTAKAGSDLKHFLSNISVFADEAILSANMGVPFYERNHCRSIFENRLKTIQDDAYKAASFSGENHHKFLLGPMIVFRMHLNKSEDYINKCDQATRGCGLPCETTPKVKRWRRLAALEIHRVQDDIKYTRRSYRDLVAHARRRLNHLRKQVTTKTHQAVEEYHECVNRGHLA